MVNLRRLLISILLMCAVLVAFVASKAIRLHRVYQREANTRALIQAVVTNDEATAIRLLDQGVNPNAIITDAAKLSSPDTVPGPLLTSAIRNGDMQLTEALIAHGAKINVLDSTKCTPLGIAVADGESAVVADLLAHGADTSEHDPTESLLLGAVTSSNVNPKIVRLLIDHSVNVNVQESEFHQTVLMRVAADYPSASHTDIVRVLLTAHPNLELRDMSGDTALKIAEKAGNADMVKVLKDAGAKEYSLFPPIKAVKVTYKITDLGLGRANAINNRGVVVGVVTKGQGDGNGQSLGQAFIWSEGRLRTLKAFHGPSSIADNINDRGQVVGEADFSNSHDASSYTGHAFLWQNDIMQDLHPRTGWTSKDALMPSEAVSISQDGQIAESVNGFLFLWKNGEWKDLTKVDTDNSIIWDTVAPVAMNNKGQVVLHLQSSGSEHAGMWENGKLRELTPPRIDTEMIEGHNTTTIENYHAEGINDNGEIVGQTDYGEPVRWSHGKVSFLPRLYHLHGVLEFQMSALHINNHGQIVGTVSDELFAQHPEQHAVLWQGGKAIDLNALIPAGSSWVLEEARGINESGQIVGYGTYQGKEHAFLLKPLTSGADKN